MASNQVRTGSLSHKLLYPQRPPAGAASNLLMVEAHEAKELGGDKGL